MRCAAIAGCMFAFLFAPAYGAETPINLSVSLDWTEHPEEMKLATELQQEKRFPLPMLYVAGKLSGLVPSTISLNSAGDAARVEVGVAQVLERPLYDVEIKKTPAGDLDVQIEFADLSMVQEYSIGDHSGPAVILNKINYSQLHVHSNGGVYALQLPAAPLAALVEYAVNTKSGMTLGSAVPLVLHDPKLGKDYPPITTRRHPGKVTDLTPTPQSNEPAIYVSTINPEWFSEQEGIAAQAGAIAADGYPSPSAPSSLFKWLGGPSLPSIELDSIPANAEIFVNGTLESPPFTNTPVRIVRNLWSRTVIRETGFRDCPVDVAQVEQDTSNSPEYKFTCKLQPSSSGP